MEKNIFFRRQFKGNVIPSVYQALREQSTKQRRLTLEELNRRLFNINERLTPSPTTQGQLVRVAYNANKLNKLKIEESEMKSEEAYIKLATPTNDRKDRAIKKSRKYRLVMTGEFGVPTYINTFTDQTTVLNQIKYHLRKQESEYIDFLNLKVDNYNLMKVLNGKGKTIIICIWVINNIM